MLSITKKNNEEEKVNIYVGNLSRELTENELLKAFQAFGEVSSAKIIVDRDTGVSRGFGFVEMPNKEEAELAIKELNGKELKGRNLVVNEARPRRNRFNRGRRY